MKAKTILAAFLMFFMLAAMAMAVPTVEYVKIDGDIHQSGDQLVVKRGETLDIRVKIKANNSEDNINVEAYIDGYEYDRYESVSDSESVFDMDTGDTEYVDLEIRIPERAEKDFYDLKVRVGTRRGASFEAQYRINLKGQRHELLIRDILMPSQIVAGRGFFANVKLKNIGQKDEDDVTVRLLIPKLDVEGYTTIDEIEADDTETSEEIVVRIDVCAEPGNYDVLVIAEFNEFEKITETSTLYVKASDACQKDSEEKTILSVPQPQEVFAGESAIFPIMITNLAKKAKTYVVTVSKGVQAFGTYRIDPSNVLIIQPGKPETVFVYVTVNEDIAQGAKDFIVSIESGDEKQDFALTANVIEDSKKASGDLKKVLESALVVLIVLLVIAGLVFGFNRLKPKEDEEELGEEDIGQTYY